MVPLRTIRRNAATRRVGGGVAPPPNWLRAEVAQHGQHAAVVRPAVGGSSSLPKMLVTCFSTARSVTTSASAIAWFERPSAISASTSRSRGVSASSGSSRRRRPSSCATTSGSSAEPPSPTRRTRVDEALDVGDAVLQQVADALGVRRRAARARSPPRRTGRARARRSRASSARICCAARRPSSVWVGGMRTSTIATSGLCARDLAQQVVGVAGLADDLEAGVLEQADEPLPQQHGVVGDRRRARDLRVRRWCPRRPGSSTLEAAVERARRGRRARAGRCPRRGRRRRRRRRLTSTAACRVARRRSTTRAWCVRVRATLVSASATTK